MRSAALVLCGLLASCGEPPPSPPAGPDMTYLPPPPTDKGPGLRFLVRGGDDMQPLPCRVLIRPTGETPRPDFHSDGERTVELNRGVIGDPEGVMLQTGAALLPLAPGSYELTIVAGPEHEMATRPVTVVGAEVTPVEVILEHPVRTDGWLAADMHIHTDRSFDSKVAALYRVLSEVTAGIEVIVPTEHVNHNDLQEQVVALGYAGRAVSIPGSEYGFRYGHLGVYPVRFEPMGRFFGAPDWQEWPWTNLDEPTYFPRIHELPGSPVIVINHPRLGPDLGYFRNIGWPSSPGEPLATASLFDGMEVLSGYEQRPPEVTALLRDWFNLLNDGRRITGLGNSDTHKLDWLRAGYPRTWLRLRADQPDRVIPDDLREAILAMRAVASNGPFVMLSAAGKGLGEVATATAGKVKARVRADAPGWIDVSRVLLYRSGVEVARLEIAERKGHPLLDTELTIDAAQDGWLVAVAVGERPLPAAVLGAVGQGAVRPLAFTNPVWLDGDGDGKVVLPKLPPADPRPLGVAPAEPGDDQASFGALGEMPLDCDPGTYRGPLSR